MEFNEFFKACETIFSKNPYLPALDEQKAKKLFLLTEHMLTINETMNLTAIKDEKAIILQHYADSLAICTEIKENSTVIDVGCGAGFPTLPLAIFRPDLKITALDGTAKRIEYVKQTAKILKLDNVTAIADRAETMAQKQEFREKFDYATARAVAALPVLTELCLPFVKVGGKFVAMKAQKANEELELSMTAIDKCGGKLESKQFKELTDTDSTVLTRVIITVSKTKSTPREFPRHYSKISKKPL